MAEKAQEVQITVTPLERQWIKRSVEVLRGTLVRSRAKEMQESEVYALRTREISAIDVLLNKLS